MGLQTPDCTPEFIKAGDEGTHVPAQFFILRQILVVDRVNVKKLHFILNVYVVVNRILYFFHIFAHFFAQNIVKLLL